MAWGFGGLCKYFRGLWILLMYWTAWLKSVQPPGLLRHGTEVHPGKFCSGDLESAERTLSSTETLRVQGAQEGHLQASHSMDRLFLAAVNREDRQVKMKPSVWIGIDKETDAPGTKRPQCCNLHRWWQKGHQAQFGAKSRGCTFLKRWSQGMGYTGGFNLHTVLTPMHVGMRPCGTSIQKAHGTDQQRDLVQFCN